MKEKTLRVVWEPMADADYREKLRQALAIVLSDESVTSSIDSFDEIGVLSQDEAGAVEQPGTPKRPS